MTDLVFSILIGLISGSLSNIVVQFLPLYLNQSWRIAAQEYLQLPISPFQAIKIRYLFYTWDDKKTWKIIILPIVHALVFGLAYLKYGWSIETWSGWLFSFFIIALVSIDARTQLLPDELTLSMLWLGLIFHLIFQNHNLNSAIVGAVLGYLFLRTLYHLFKWYSGQEAMGFGDFKMAAALGAWLGWQSLLPIFFMAALLGLVAAVALKKSRQQTIVFGPFLGIAAWIYWWQTEQIERMMAWYF